MEQQIRTTIENISCQDMNYVVIIGITGCGKSSITCCLAHKKLQYAKEKEIMLFLKEMEFFQDVVLAQKNHQL